MPSRANSLLLWTACRHRQRNCLLAVIQLEHRGIVLGDRSAGDVMEAQIYSFSQGTECAQIWYAFLLTEADLIMKDGKSPEHVGVNAG